MKKFRALNQFALTNLPFINNMQRAACLKQFSERVLPLKII